MKRLSSGCIIRIPLLKEMGYAYSKYVDLTKLSDETSLAEVIKVFNFRTIEKVDDINLSDYLIAPISVAGLRPTLRKGIWHNMGKIDLDNSDSTLPDFMSSYAGDNEVPKGKYFIFRESDLSKKENANYEDVKFLQPFGGEGTGLIEIRLTMYFILREGKKIEDFFDLTDETNKWQYDIVQDSLLLPE